MYVDHHGDPLPHRQADKKNVLLKSRDTMLRSLLLCAEISDGRLQEMYDLRITEFENVFL